MLAKNTIGQLVAQAIDYHFVDIDLYFCDRIALIPDYINQHGYVAYYEANSRLVDQLVQENPDKTVFATLSGFLVHEESPNLADKHLDLIKKSALSVLLLPSEDPLETIDLVVGRQLLRWPELKANTERERYIKRHGKYKQYGDIQIIGTFQPKETVKLVVKKMELFGNSS